MTASDTPRPEDVDLDQALPEGGMYRQEPRRDLPMSVDERVERLDEELRDAEPESPDPAAG